MTTEYTPAETFAPGEYLRDELDARGWTAVEFADILGRPEQVISQIINDRKEITPTTALEISEALGTSAEIWLNLQAVHQLRLARADDLDVTRVSRRALLRSLVPVREMRNRGWLPDTDDLDELEAAVCEMLEISSLGQQPRITAVARRADQDKPFSPEQTAWLARVARLAETKSVGAFRSDHLPALARDIPQRLRDPEDLEHLDVWLADVGVILITQMPLRSSKIDGAVLNRQDDTPVIGLTTRWNRFDGFVFTLLHELAHIVLGHLKSFGVSVDLNLAEDQATAGPEGDANQLAGSWIFPDGLDVDGPVSTAEVLRLADRYRVHPSLVIGRLQHDGKLGWSQLRAHIPRVRPLLQRLKE